MASGMSPGAPKSAASGLMNDRSGAAAALSWLSASQSRFAPAWFHTRRHSCTSHSPVMFFSKRVVPPMPPSLVKFSFNTESLMTGCGDSMPSRAQVPRLT